MVKSKIDIYSAAKLILVLLFFSGCKREILNLSPQPKITNTDLLLIKNIENKDSLIKLIINFTDGDGDFGLNVEDNQPPFNFGSVFFYNVRIYYFSKNNDDLFEPFMFSGSHFVQQFRIPRIKTNKNNEPMIAELDVLLLTNVGGLKPSELRFEVDIIDRNLNISDRAITKSLNIKH